MKLPATTAALSGFTDVHKLTAEAITSIGSGGSVTIAVLPPGACITNCVVTTISPHAGTSTDLVLDVGIVGIDEDGLMDAVSLTGQLGETIAGNGYLYAGGVTQATALIEPDGSNNKVLYTAPAGTDGNSTTVTYATPAAVAPTAVAVAGQAITVTPGTKARMVITGTLTSDGSTEVTFPELLYDGVFDGKPSYGSGSGNEFVSWDGSASKWFLQDINVGAEWASTADVATPDLVPSGAWHADSNPTGWKPTSPATGTPVVTAGISSAAQVITAVNATPAAAALVTASASGTVTGAVAAVTATALTGGLSAANTVNVYANATGSQIEIAAKTTFTGTVTAGEYLICMTILNPNMLAEV